MYDDLVPGREAGQNLGDAIVPMTDPDRDLPGAPVLNSENRPLVTLPEQCAHRYGDGIRRAPGGDVDDDAVVVTEWRPRLRRTREVDRHAHALLLDAERGYLEKSGWIDTDHL